MTHPDTLTIPRAIIEQALAAFESCGNVDQQWQFFNYDKVEIAKRALRAALQPQQSNPESGCMLCANGNDIPDGEWCRACGFSREPNLARAVRLARGGTEPPRHPVKFAALQPQAAVEPLGFTEETRVGSEFLDGPVDQAETKVLGVRVQEDTVIIKMKGGKRWGNQLARELCHKLLTDREPGGNPNAFNKWS